MWPRDEFEWARTASIQELGMSGYCKLVSKILYEHLPDADVYGFENEETNGFDHVYLVREGKAIDIKGVRSPQDVHNDPNVEPAAPARQVSWEELDNAVFISDTDPDESAIVKKRVRDFIDANPAQFGL